VSLTSLINHRTAEIIEKSVPAFGSESTWSVVGSIRGRLRPLSAGERFIMEQRNIIATHVFYCIPPMTANTNQRLRISGDDYVINEARDPMTMGKYLRLSLKLVV